MVDPKELILPERRVEEAFLRRPTVEPNILPEGVIDTVAILLNQRNIIV